MKAVEMVDRLDLPKVPSKVFEKVAMMVAMMDML